MKKGWLLLLVLLCVLCIPVTASAKKTEVDAEGRIFVYGDGEGEIFEHEHQFQWMTSYSATDTHSGKKMFYCTKCGFIKKYATIKAKGKYKITYVLNGGKNNGKNPIAYNTTTKTLKLKSAKKKGYTFAGWYSNKRCTKKVTSIKQGSKGNKKLYAKWKLRKYKVIYHLNGGKNNPKNRKTYTKNTKAFQLKNPTRKGYNFLGWYTYTTYTDDARITEIKKGCTWDTVVYALWEKKGAIYHLRDQASVDRFEECRKIMLDGVGNQYIGNYETFINYADRITIINSTTDGAWMAMYVKDWENSNGNCEATTSIAEKCLKAIAPEGGQELYKQIAKLIKKYGSPYDVPEQGVISESIPGLIVTISQSASGLCIEFWCD